MILREYEIDWRDYKTLDDLRALAQTELDRYETAENCFTQNIEIDEEDSEKFDIEFNRELAEALEAWRQENALFYFNFIEHFLEVCPPGAETSGVANARKIAAAIKWARKLPDKAYLIKNTYTLDWHLDNLSAELLNILEQ